MTSTRHELRTLLEDAGSRPAVPRPEFVTELETRLLAKASVSAPTSLVERSQARSRARFVRPAFVAAAAAVAAVVLAGSLSGWFGRATTRHEVALARAVDTVVVLPDGTQIKARDGLALPDGVVVKTGPTRHAAVGPVDLGPGQTAVVVGGRIQISTPTLPPVSLPVTVPTVPGVSLP
jgi:hypothetical protein